MGKWNHYNWTEENKLNKFMPYKVPSAVPQPSTMPIKLLSEVLEFTSFQVTPQSTTLKDQNVDICQNMRS